MSNSKLLAPSKPLLNQIHFGVRWLGTWDYYTFLFT